MKQHETVAVTAVTWKTAETIAISTWNSTMPTIHDAQNWHETKKTEWVNQKKINSMQLHRMTSLYSMFRILSCNKATVSWNQILKGSLNYWGAGLSWIQSSEQAGELRTVLPPEWAWRGHWQGLDHLWVRDSRDSLNWDRDSKELLDLTPGNLLVIFLETFLLRPFAFGGSTGTYPSSVSALTMGSYRSSAS